MWDSFLTKSELTEITGKADSVDVHFSSDEINALQLHCLFPTSSGNGIIYSSVFFFNFRFMYFNFLFLRRKAEMELQILTYAHIHGLHILSIF